MIRRNAKKSRIPKFNQRYVLVHFKTEEEEGNFSFMCTGGSVLSLEFIGSLRTDIAEFFGLNKDEVLILNIMGL